MGLDEAGPAAGSQRSNHEAATTASSGPAAREGSDASTVSLPPADLEAERTGDRIGPYRLFESLGQGGMGIVYRAEQREPIRRAVALKLIKLGMDTQQVIARFESERQALALMNHPAIAQVYDAGATPRGRPYFAMEYVDGIPITDYCDKHRLPQRQRLDLFIQVCEGVQHAHQKGIIHRDLKPSNVLVKVQDNRPIPKIIDFGVAKAISQKLTEKTVHTQLGQIIGTPAYMSPEQAEMTPLDIDTRTDIYSLGVMLYELLAGALPFDPVRLSKLSYPELQRIIREEEPPRPSTRISTLDTAEKIAKARQTDVRTLVKRLKGDLDWITMRALDKDRTRRYASASELAADIARYLHDEPVVARPPSTVYRLGKFIRKYKGPVAAATAVVLTALALGSVAFWQGQVAQRRGRDLQRQAERVHMLVALPAFVNLRDHLDALAEGLVRIFGDLSIDRDWHVGHAPGQQLLADPSAAADRVGVEV